jgi:hypothetical protein
MDAHDFDALARLLGRLSSRRAALGLSLVSGLGSLSSLFIAEARRKHKKKKKRRKKRCGPCQGGACQNGACVCPFGRQCSPGVCCANEQTCQGDACGACPVGVTPCDANLLCGKTPDDKPCVCATTVAGEGACITADLAQITCFACASDADCESELGLAAGETVCIGGLDCQGACGATDGKACAIRGCRVV